MSRDWALFLGDIAAACCLVEQFTAGLTGESFARNAQAFHATVRNLEIIGEAAKRLPEEVKARMPEVVLPASGMSSHIAILPLILMSYGTSSKPRSQHSVSPHRGY